MTKVLVVCHDAGAANILSALVKKYRRDFKWISYVSGPAKDIFLKEGISVHSCPIKLKPEGASKIVDRQNPDLVLTGTGWQSAYYLNFIKAAKAKKIKTASFLDHWCNYRQRFGFPAGWKDNLPDFVFTGDKWSYELAQKEGFPKNALLQVENPYFEDICRKAVNQYQKGGKRSAKLRILYLSGPVYEHAAKLHKDPYSRGYTEYSIMEHLLKIMKLSKGTRSLEFRVRLHPAEKIDKYAEIINNHDFKELKRQITVSSAFKNTLIKDCAWSNLVIGSESMALVTAFISGRYAVSYRPGAERKKYLPQKEIKRIYSFNRLKDLIMDHDFSQAKKYSRIAPKKLFKMALEKIGCRKG